VSGRSGGAGHREWRHIGNEGRGATVRARISNRMTSMKRLLIFAAIAPPLGFVVAFWVMLQIANWLAGSPSTFDVGQIMMLPTIYLVG
jgi:hypothetical protein